ncbi:MAG: MarR family transcriptional regulator [Candidatus Omnitrophica bacterium]|nr:MarR family transcriptional regulator [Candidatus Omnitrophota bacterium]
MRRGSIEQFKQAGVDIGLGRCHEEMVYGLALMYTAIYDEIGAALKKYNLTPGELNVLMLIKHQGGSQGLSQVDLGQRLMVTAHNMTRLIQRLEKGSLVGRSIDKKDGRVNLVKITLKGSRLLDQIWPGYNQKLQSLAGRLSKEDQLSLAGLIQKWLGVWRSLKV